MEILVSESKPIASGTELLCVPSERTIPGVPGPCEQARSLSGQNRRNHLIQKQVRKILVWDEIPGKLVASASEPPAFAHAGRFPPREGVLLMVPEVYIWRFVAARAWD